MLGGVRGLVQGEISGLLEVCRGRHKRSGGLLGHIGGLLPGEPGWGAGRPGLRLWAGAEVPGKGA